MPPDHVPGMVSWLRDFTDLPLGVYPNLGYLSAHGWRSETAIGGAEYAELALQWREEGAQIVGGCCGVGVEHVAAARAALADTKPGTAHPPVPGDLGEGGRGGDRLRFPRQPRPWRLPARHPRTSWVAPGSPGRTPVLVPAPGVTCTARAWARTSAASTWVRAPACWPCSSRATARRHVHAVDIRQPAAVANTLDHAFRNGVADRGHRDRAGPLSLGAGGALRPHRREPRPESRPTR